MTPPKKAAPESGLIAIESVTLDPENKRKHDEKNLAAIAASLDKFGQQSPIVLDSKDRCLKGNGTIRAAMELGWTEIAFVRSDLKGRKAEAYAVADNRAGELATWEERELAAFLQDQHNIGELECTGFAEEDLDALIEKVESDLAELSPSPEPLDEDEDDQDEEGPLPEPGAELIARWNTADGQLWKIGQHFLHIGDCREHMAGMPPDSIDCILTDPPYGLNFMGKGWDHGVPGVDFWTEALRVTKPGAMLIAFGGTRTYHRLACAIEDSGFELRDCLSWIYGSGFPKSLDISKAIDRAAGAEREVVGTRSGLTGSGFGNVGHGLLSEPDAIEITKPATAAAAAWNGWGTALKPAWEPAILAMKPTEGTFAENAEKWGVAGLNVDGGRIHAEDAPSGRTRHGGGVPGSGSSYELPDSNGESPAGRWPANVALDEPAAAMLDEQSGNLTSGANPSKRNSDIFKNSYGDFEGQRDCTVHRGADSGGASRFFYTAKAGKADRGGDFNRHPTVKPTSLMEWLAKLTLTPSGGIVLEPFAGSGTTIVACERVGRPCVAIEQDPGHAAIILERLSRLGLEPELI